MFDARHAGRVMTRAKKLKKATNLKTALGTQNKHKLKDGEPGQLNDDKQTRICPNGTPIVKHWKGTPHKGNVVACDSENKWCKILCEGNDREDLTEAEVNNCSDKEAIAQTEVLKHIISTCLKSP